MNMVSGIFGIQIIIVRSLKPFKKPQKITLITWKLVSKANFKYYYLKKDLYYFLIHKYLLKNVSCFLELDQLINS